MSGSIVGAILLGVLAVLVVISLTPIVRPGEGRTAPSLLSQRGWKGLCFLRDQFAPRP
jgi:hypothetical protein